MSVPLHPTLHGLHVSASLRRRGRVLKSDPQWVDVAPDDFFATEHAGEALPDFFPVVAGTLPWLGFVHPGNRTGTYTGRVENREEPTALGGSMTVAAGRACALWIPRELRHRLAALRRW